MDRKVASNTTYLDYKLGFGAIAQDTAKKLIIKQIKQYMALPKPKFLAQVKEIHNGYTIRNQILVKT